MNIQMNLVAMLSRVIEYTRNGKLKWELKPATDELICNPNSDSRISINIEGLAITYTGSLTNWIEQKMYYDCAGIELYSELKSIAYENSIINDYEAIKDLDILDDMIREV